MSLYNTDIDARTTLSIEGQDLEGTRWSLHARFRVSRDHGRISMVGSFRVDAGRAIMIRLKDVGGITAPRSEQANLHDRLGSLSVSPGADPRENRIRASAPIGTPAQITIGTTVLSFEPRNSHGQQMRATCEAPHTTKITRLPHAQRRSPSHGRADPG